MTADSVNIWANGFLIVSLIVGVVATFAIVLSGNIKEKELKRELSKANERAAQLESDAAKAEEKTANLEVEAEKTKEAVAGANERAAHAEARAAEAKLELAKFKAPRILSEAQRTAFTKSLSGAPRGRFFIMFKSGDDESRSFAIQIHDLLLSAGYEYKNTKNSLGWFQNGEPRKGIAIRVGSVEKQPLSAGPLQRAFESIGIEPLGLLGAFEEDVVDIMIGAKP